MSKSLTRIAAPIAGALIGSTFGMPVLGAAVGGFGGGVATGQGFMGGLEDAAMGAGGTYLGGQALQALSPITSVASSAAPDLSQIVAAPSLDLGASMAPTGAASLSGEGLAGATTNATLDFAGPTTYFPTPSNVATMSALGNTVSGSQQPATPQKSNMLSNLGTAGTLGMLALRALPAAASIGSGVAGLNAAQRVAAQSDPFAPYRSQYAQQLQDLESNPSSVANTPGYTAGLQAVQRSMAANGYMGSGNMMAALQKYGGDFYQNQVSQLATLAGAGATPGAGSVPAANLESQSLASMGYGLNQLNNALAPVGG